MVATPIVCVFHVESAVNKAWPVSTGALLTPPDSPPNVNNTKVSAFDNIRFKQADDSNSDATAPIPIPAIATPSNFSYRKATKLRFDSAPPARIFNLRWFRDAISAAWPSGVGIKVATCTEANASQALAVVGDSVTDVFLTGTWSPAPTADTSYFDPGSNLVIQASDVIGPLGATYSVLNPQLSSSACFGGSFQPFVVTQMKVDPGAAPGATPVTGVVRYVYRYDEQ